MNKSRKFLAVFLLAAFAVGSALGQTETHCRVYAYVYDKDPAGLNVRSGPGADFSVLAAIPLDEDGISVNVIAAQGKWFRISHAENAEGEPVISEAGWVFGPLLAIRSVVRNGSTIPLYASPTKRGKVRARVKDEEEFVIEGCRGDWILVRSTEGKNESGWLSPEGQCGNPRTTCP